MSDEEVQIDNWNGKVEKDNVKVKKTALSGLFAAAFGTPVQVVQGYIKKIKIDIPWNKILSDPVEVWVDDLHVILKSGEKYDRNFVKK